MDKKTFTDSILSLNDQLYRLAKSILNDEAEAADTVQELYLKLWEKGDEMLQVINMRTFTLRSLHNLCIDHLRKRKEHCELSSEWESNFSSPIEAVEDKYLQEIIKEAIDRLPELQRTIIRLKDVEGFEIKEIAYITSSTENAVTTNLSRARQKIRNQLIALKIRNIE